MKTFPDKSFDLVLTDPPYPINTNNGTNRFTEKGWFDGSADNYGDDWYKKFEEVLIQVKRVLRGGRHFYCFVDEKNLFLLKPYLDKHMEFKKVIVWHKKVFGLGYHYRNVIEYCFLYANGKSKRFVNDQPNFFMDDKDNIEGHPTVKSSNMFKWLIKNSTDENESVLDCYVGSGTTLVAAKLLNRNAVGIEISPEYCKIAEDRLRQGVLL